MNFSQIGDFTGILTRTVFESESEVSKNSYPGYIGIDDFKLVSELRFGDIF